MLRVTLFSELCLELCLGNSGKMQRSDKNGGPNRLGEHGGI
jgi:hypothetical protein